MYISYVYVYVYTILHRYVFVILSCTHIYTCTYLYRYTQSANQEFLSYQFAGLVLKVYTHIIAGLGKNYDLSTVTQELRLNHWVEPIFLKLQEFNSRFLSVNVDEKLEEMYVMSFDKVLENIQIDIQPKYTLSTYTSSSSSSSSSSKNIPKNTLASYPVWEYSNFISKFLRNIINNIDIYTLDIKIARMFQSNLSVRMRSIAKPLEKIALGRKMVSDVPGEAENKEVRMVEEMLNIGHLVTAAVYASWHVSYSIYVYMYVCVYTLLIYVYMSMRVYNAVCVYVYMYIYYGHVYTSLYKSLYT